MTISPDDSNVHFSWRITQDAARVLALHLGVLEKAPTGMVRPDQLAHFERHMGADGQTLGCFLDNGKMVGYGVLGLQSPTVAHLAELLEAGTARFCVLDGAAALPEWRGHGLHCAGINERIRYAGALGRDLIGATVAPQNIRSIRGLFNAGFEVRRFAYVYGGLARLIMQRDLAVPRDGWRRATSVGTGDTTGHQAALTAGLTGYACVQNTAGLWQIEYGHPDPQMNATDRAGARDSSGN